MLQTGKKKWLSVAIFCVLVFFCILVNPTSSQSTIQQAPDKNGYVTKVYDVSDLILEAYIPNYDFAPLGWFATETKNRPAKTESEISDMLVTTIKELTSDKIWSAGTAISVQNGILTITNKREVHDKIQKYLDVARLTLNLGIEIEAKLLNIDAATDKEIQNKFKFDGMADKSVNYTYLFLSKDQLEEVIKMAKQSPKTSLLSLPKTVSHNGQQTRACTARSQAMAVGILKEYGSGNIYATYASGVVFDYDSTVSEDRTSVTTVFNGGSWDLIDSSPEIITSSSLIKTTVTLPDDSILVFRKPVEYQKVTGIAVGSDGKLEVKDTPDNSKERKFIYFIIHPKVVQMKPATN